MKYCQNCGTQVQDDAIFCPNCGSSLENASNTVNNGSYTENQQPKENIMATLAKVFMVIGTVCNGFAILPLAWCIPMTVSYFKKVKTGQHVETGFKVCSLLFVSMLGGIFMLCDSEH